MLGTDDPFGTGLTYHGLTCQQIVAMRGGWQNITAEDAAWLAQGYCYPDDIFGNVPFVSINPQGYIADLGGGDSGGGAAAPPSILSDISPYPVSANIQDTRSQQLPQEAPMLDDWNPQLSGFNVSAGLFPSLLQSVGDIFGGGGGGTAGPRGGAIEIADDIRKAIGYVTGQSAPKAGLISGACPPGRRLKRVALGRDICVKRPTMNPLNPKALRRATTRISRFHAFAMNAEKEMAKAFRKGGFHAAKRSTAKCTTCNRKRCSCG